jgi:hypothetical protein
MIMLFLDRDNDLIDTGSTKTTKNKDITRIELTSIM